MARILSLPRGVHEKLYSDALSGIPLIKRLKARKLMLDHGKPMATALSEHGVAVLDIVEKHKDVAVEAIKRHDNAIPLYKEHGSRIFPILAVLEPKLLQHIGRLGEPEVMNLYYLVTKNSRASVRAMVRRSTKGQFAKWLAETQSQRERR